MENRIAIEGGVSLVQRRALLTKMATLGICLLGGSRLTWAKGSDASAACPAPTPKHIEGPYYVVENRKRSDLRIDSTSGVQLPGVPLTLTLRVRGGEGGCAPLVDALVDVWHCDAVGVYSDVVDPHYNTVGHDGFRGYQVTDHNGEVRFQTIVPGRYEVRATHIHVKVRQKRGFTPADLGETMRIVAAAHMPAPSGADAAAPPLLRQEFTTQLYIDDAITDAVYQRVPYRGKVQNAIVNDKDIFFNEGGGRRLIIPLMPDEVGYAGVYTIVLPETDPV